MKDDLCPKIWEDYQLDDEVKEELLSIGKDFFEKVELPTEYIDIVLCGSLL
jgi:hypothetical protein